MEILSDHAYDGFTMTISSSMMASSQCHCIQENGVGLERRGGRECWATKFYALENRILYGRQQFILMNIVMY